MKRKSGIILMIVLTILAILAVLGIGYHLSKLNALKSALKPLALQDEALFNELLALTKSLPQITLADLSAAAQKNIDARNQLMEKVRAVPPYNRKKQIGLLLELMGMENEYARSLVSLKRAWVEAASQPREEMVTEVEEVQRGPKQKPLFREKVFKRTLLQFRGAVDKARAASQAHLRTSNNVLAFEKSNEGSLSSIVPKRNTAPLLEQLIREEGTRDWGLAI